MSRDVRHRYTIKGKSDHDGPHTHALCTECGEDAAATLDDSETCFCFNCFSWRAKLNIANIAMSRSRAMPKEHIGPAANDATARQDRCAMTKKKPVQFFNALPIEIRI